MAEPKKPQDRKPKKGTDPKVTIDGVEYTVSMSGLADPRTQSMVSLMQEAADIRQAGNELDREMAGELSRRFPSVLRLVLGLRGEGMAQERLAAKHGSEYGLQHAIQFFFDVLKAAAPNS